VTVFVLGLATAIALPAWEGYETHKQSQAAVRFAESAAAALAQGSVKDGRWPEDLSGKLPEKLDLPGDDYSRDLRIAECYQESCALVVTFTDERYQRRLRDHSFVLRSQDGGKTWTCGPGGERPALAVDLPSSCRGAE
jgi:type II secretory pathway pseudopilin PulG